MFISQTLSSLARDIINQIRVYFFGFGLGWGLERQALLELIGGADQALRLYQMFKDPQSSLGKKEYPFMSIGPISPLSFSGSPLCGITNKTNLVAISVDTKCRSIKSATFVGAGGNFSENKQREPSFSRI